MTDKIPEFDADGLLPPGDYEVTLAELRNSILCSGPADRNLYANWDSSWRLWLVDQLAMMADQLWQVGVEFPAAFRRCRRDSKLRGIIRLKKEASI